MTAIAPQRTAESVAAVDLAIGALASYERPDLTARLTATKRRLRTDHIQVLIVGEFKKGKSMLVNGLVGAPACPVLDDLATVVPTVVTHADTATVTLIRQLDTGETHRSTVPTDDLTRYATEQGNRDNHERLHRVEVGLPSALLRGGLELVDTPGIGGLSSVPAAATRAALPSADAVLLVSDASQEYTAPELDFLRTALAASPNVACVLTKTDLYPRWRRIAEVNRAHLAAAGITVPMFPVSAMVRWQALSAADEAARRELNTESGFPALVRFLRSEVVEKADQLARRSTAHDVLTVVDQVATVLRAERDALSDPERTRDVIAALTEAEQRATALKERSARWQQTLNDGVADLNADIDYDLRDRLREITRAAEETITEGGDPTKTWEQFAAWVEGSSATAASANYVFATQRARWLAGRVADHFDAERTNLVPELTIGQQAPLRAVRALTVREAEQWGIGRRLLTGVRGGYMGVLMFGMLGTLVGFALLNPLSVGAGVLLGRRSIVDEKRRIITKRQNEVKIALRRYVDDVTFHVSKDSRDMLRGVQRVLRDHFTARADELKRSIQDSLKAAEQTVRAKKAERDARLAELATELSALDTVANAARALVGVPR